MAGTITRRLLPLEYATRNATRSSFRFAASVVGAWLVVVLTMSAAAFVRGMEASLAVSARDENVILLGAGSEESIERSQISPAIGGLVEAAVPGVRRRLGASYVSPEIHMAMSVKSARDSRDEWPAVLRGVTPAAFLVHPQVRIVQGRAPIIGRDEIAVGDLAHARLGADPADLQVGRSLWFDERPWKIVGRFSAPNTVMNAEIWCPLTNLQVATRRDSSVSCVVIMLDDAEFADVDAFCKQRLDLELVAIPEREYYARLKEFYTPVRALVWVTAILIALGGLLGGLNTMYAAFAARVRELGALQTLGYSRGAIVISLMQESVFLSLLGTLAAAVVAVVLLDRLSVRFSMGAFGLIVDGWTMTQGLAAGVILGVVGALPPAWRCLRLSIPESLRAG
jgi:putative ABC transport system permease protein